MLSLGVVLTFLFLLSVHGQEVVAKVRFLRHQFVRYEGPTGMFCITVVNEPASSIDFRVSYTFTSNLLGAPTAGTRDGTLNFAAGASAASMCIPTRDDLVACEPDIVGTVTLVNSTSVHIGLPSTATVTIKDNDPLNLSFETAAFSYSEGSGAVVGNTPVVSVINDHTQLANPVRFMVVETRGLSDNLIDRSLTVDRSEFTLSNGQTSHAIGLTIGSDQTALEADEIVTLSIVPVSPFKCFAVNVAPINTTQITVTDTNGVAVGLRDSQLSVKENARRVEVCVEVSATLARPLPFTLRPTSQGTAGGGVDFTGTVFEGRFEPFSSQREICTFFSVVGDGVVEVSESFSVELSINEGLLRMFGDRIHMTNLVTTITIVDTSHCTNIVVDSGSNGTLYLPPSSSICFSCQESPNSPSVAQTWSWSVNSVRLSGEFTNGEVYSNGTLLIVNSSKLFSPTQPQLVITCSSTPTLASHSANVVLGASPTVYALTHSFGTLEEHVEMMLTCIFSGSPRPNVTWWLGERLIPDPAAEERVSKKVTVVTTEMQSVLQVKELNSEDIGRYRCVAENQFGETSADSYLTRQQLDFYTMPKPQGHSAARSLHVPLYLNLLLTLCVLIVCKL